MVMESGRREALALETLEMEKSKLTTLMEQDNVEANLTMFECMMRTFDMKHARWAY